MKQQLVIGTRASKLALWQARHVAALIERRYPAVTVTLRPVVTSGDTFQETPLAQLGGKGLFTQELESAMLAGEIDLAVHSLKDMPSELPDKLVLAAVMERDHAGDALVAPRCQTLDQLPPGAVVGTSSLRRKAQLQRYRSDLVLRELRGNVDTRLSKLEQDKLDAIVLAVAGLRRLGWEERISEILSPQICLPAAGQGALALEARRNDERVGALLAFLHHEPTSQAVTAERAFLQTVESGCQAPIGVYAVVTGDGLTLEAAILSVDGQAMVRETVSGSKTEASRLGRGLAQRLLAAGGADILRHVR